MSSQSVYVRNALTLVSRKVRMEKEKFKKFMCSYGKQIDIEFNDKQLNQFYEYMKLLLKWNEKINLTAITEKDEIVLKHFIDSLSISKYIDKNSKII